MAGVATYSAAITAASGALCSTEKISGGRWPGASTVQKQLEAGSTEVVFGITFHRISTPDGELLMKPHDLLNEYGYSKAAIVIDPANVYRAIQKPLEATELDRDKTGLSPLK